jgi:hypothetical protein
MNIDDDDLIAAGDMSSEDLHRELERLVVMREPHWPDCARSEPRLLQRQHGQRIPLKRLRRGLSFPARRPRV